MIDVYCKVTKKYWKIHIHHETSDIDNHSLQSN